jgi:hypothetical protein
MSKSCCKPSRREVMRLSALIAGGTLVSVAGADRAYAASTRSAGVSPVFLDLVTVTEDSAIMTWYTGVPGTSDGTGQMKPAPAEGELLFGTGPSRLNRRVSEILVKGPEGGHQVVECTLHTDSVFAEPPDPVRCRPKDQEPQQPLDREDPQDELGAQLLAALD